MTTKEDLRKTAKLEHHDWGYFIFTDDEAVAIVSHNPRHLEAVLERMGKETHAIKRDSD